MPGSSLLLEAHTDPPRGESESNEAQLRFGLWLGVTTLVALLLRVLYVLVVTRHEAYKLYDAAYYELQALALSTGRFFPVFFGHGPDAAHPPLTSFVITPVTYLFGLSPGETPQRLTMAVLGSAVVLFVGLLGRRLAGPRVGIVAAVVAALYPNMWIPNGIVMSETVSMLLMVLILLAAYRFLDSPGIANGVLLGIGCGLEILTRAELIVLLPLLLVPAAFGLKGLPWGRRLMLTAASLLAALVVVSPWVGRNMASFRDPTFISTGEGPVLLGANCPQTYYGPALGSWSLQCSIEVPPAQDQSVESARQSEAGLHYLERHSSRLPIVIGARIGRVWDLYEPLQMVDTEVNEGRPAPASFAGLLAYYLLLPFAVAGLVILRRRSVKVWPLLVSAVAVTLIAAVSYGLVRFRAEFEVSLVVLAGVGIVATAQGLTAQYRKRFRRLGMSPPS
ncbi:MAG: glycosyltransferase family 39 protein [Acidimicrobiales bacterium]